MATSMRTKLLISLALLSTAAPAVLAEPSNAERFRQQALINQMNINAAQHMNRHDRDWDRDRDWDHDRGRHNGWDRDDWRRAERQRFHAYRVDDPVNRWDWDRHQWREQREYMRQQWAARQAMLNAQQRAMLDAQLRQQWLAYHNNVWSGGYGWNQYNDPEFLDYVHSNNPGLINSLRNLLGF